MFKQILLNFQPRSVFDKNYAAYDRIPWIDRAFYSEFLVNAFYTLSSASLPPGDIIDGGCNIGYHSSALSYIASRWKSQLVCIDPNLKCLSRCKYFFDLQNFSSYKLVHAGLFEKDTQGFFHNEPGPNEVRQDSFCTTTADLATEPVTLRSLDSIVREFDLKPSIIKLDLEGFEISAFKAMSSALRTRPILSFEFPHKNYTNAEIDACYDFFSENEYISFDAFGNIFQKENWNIGGPWNRFAVPKSFADFIPELRREFEKIHAQYAYRSL